MGSGELFALHQVLFGSKSFLRNGAWPMSPPRICDLGAAAVDAAAIERACALGFDHVAGDDAQSLAACGMPALANIELTEFSPDDPLVEAHPDWFAVRSLADPARVVDPRCPPPVAGRAMARVYVAPEGFHAHWRDRLEKFASDGMRGFRL